MDDAWFNLVKDFKTAGKQKKTGNARPFLEADE
jgi:hypothetical protein